MTFGWVLGMLLAEKELVDQGGQSSAEVYFRHAEEFGLAEALAVH